MSDQDPTDLEQQEVRDDLRRVSALLSSENEKKDFVWLMQGTRGRRIVCRLLEHAGVMRSSFRLNAMEMSHAEGTKVMGYWLLDLIERSCPEHYHTMMQEKRNARTVASHRSKPNN